MKNKIILLLMVILTLLLAVSAVSASDNATDAVATDDAVSQEPIAQDEADVAVPEEAENGDILSASDEDALQTVDREVTAQDKDADLKKVNDISTSKPNITAPKTSKISASNAVGYQKFTSKIKIKLTADGKPLASKKVTIKLNGRTFKKVTDKSGKVTLKYNLAKVGKHIVRFSYDGDGYTTPAKGTSKIIIKKSYKTRLVVGDKYLNYRQGSKCLFYVKLVADNGRPVKGKVVKFKVSGKSYRAKTNRNGFAKIYLNLKKGNHKVTYRFSHDAPYIGSAGSHKIFVRPSMGKGNGYWLWPMHMKSVNLKSLANRGTKQIVLHAEAVSAYGKSYVKSFIKKAHRYGIKVHLWIQICYDENGWVSPVNKDLTLKYGFMNSKVREAVRFAKIDGVDGLHLDYVRFGGTAHNYKSSAIKAINYIVKWTSYQVHKVRPNCIVSAAVMPEPDMMHYYYGQDIPTMSKYLDAILPMVYKGSYGKGTGWIKSVTNTFVKQSKGAQIWTGLQSYRSENDLSKLSQSELIKDARSAKAGGAKGVILFRVGISHNFYFNKV